MMGQRAKTEPPDVSAKGVQVQLPAASRETGRDERAVFVERGAALPDGQPLSVGLRKLGQRQQRRRRGRKLGQRQQRRRRKLCRLARSPASTRSPGFFTLLRCQCSIVLRQQNDVLPFAFSPSPFPSARQRWH
jgi:hypothetical protein